MPMICIPKVEWDKNKDARLVHLRLYTLLQSATLDTNFEVPNRNLADETSALSALHLSYAKVSAI